MKKLLFLPLFMLLISSCEEDAIQNSESTELTSVANMNGYKLDNGRLVFESKETLRSAFNEVSKMSEQEIAAWEKGISFKSLKTSQEGIFENLMSQAFSPILNSEGEYQVGNDIIWFNGNTEYILTNTSEREFQDLKTKVLSNQNVSEGKNLKIIEITEHRPELNDTQNTNARGDGEVQQHGTINLSGHGKIHHLPVGASKIFTVRGTRLRHAVNPYAFSDYYLGLYLGVSVRIDEYIRRSWRASDELIRGSLRFSISVNGANIIGSGFPVATFDRTFRRLLEAHYDQNYVTDYLTNVEFYIDEANFTWDTTDPAYDPVAHTYVYRNATYRYSKIII